MSLRFIDLSERRYQQARTAFLNRHRTHADARWEGFLWGCAVMFLVMSFVACLTR